MERLFENGLTLLFCCAVSARLIHHIRQKTCADRYERFMLFTIGAGFTAGTLGAGMAAEECSAMLHCLGVYLTYVTLLFSWPYKAASRNGEAEK